MSDRNASKREKLVDALTARYNAVRRGQLKPATKEEALRSAVGLRMNLNIAWGGVRGATKMASIIVNLDKAAVKEEKADD